MEILVSTGINLKVLRYGIISFFLNYVGELKCMIRISHHKCAILILGAIIL